MNQWGLRQRYAQELERKCGTGTILFAKGDLFQLIWNVGGFEQQGPLWDSPYNLQQMAEMQNDMLVHRNKLGAINRLYGGLVTDQYDQSDQMIKVRRLMLQSRERGAQRMEPATG